MTGWDVTVEGHGLQGNGTDLRTAAERVADAHKKGRPWRVLVRGPRDSAFRPPTEAEGRTFVAAVVERVTT
jgi:hypothetical protein